MKLPIRTRLTAWYVLFLAAVLLALGAFLVLKLRSDLGSSIDRSVRASTGAIAANFADDGVTGFHAIAPAALRRSGDAAQIITPQGQVAASYGGDLAQDPMVSRAHQLAALAGSQALFGADLGDSSHPFRLMVMRVSHRGRPGVLVVAAPMQDANAAVRRILLLLVIAGPIALAAAAFAGWLIVRNALLPVERMRQKAERIEIDHLHERLSSPAPHDEIGQLAGTLNAMLDRLESGVRAKRTLIADASHELRTPLAAMRAELDVSLRRDGRSQEDREVLESVREEVEKMSRTVDNLLTLARADEGRLELLLSEADLRELAGASLSALRPLAAAKDLRARVSGPECPLVCDPQRIRQALTNLIENAIEFTPDGGEVTVSIWCRGGEGGVTVADTGPGIPAKERERVFDRFYRSDPSRSRQTGGSGLGLAICVEIASAHGGRVYLEDPGNRSGAAVTLALPLDVAPPRRETPEEVLDAYRPGSV